MKTSMIKVLIAIAAMATLLSACGSSKETDVVANQGKTTVENDEKLSSESMLPEGDDINEETNEFIDTVESLPGTIPCVTYDELFGHINKPELDQYAYEYIKEHGKSNTEANAEIQYIGSIYINTGVEEFNSYANGIVYIFNTKICRNDIDIEYVEYVIAENITKKEDDSYDVNLNPYSMQYNPSFAKIPTVEEMLNSCRNGSALTENDCANIDHALCNMQTIYLRGLKGCEEYNQALANDNIVWEVSIDSDNDQVFLEEVAKRFKSWMIGKSKYEYPNLYENVSSTFAN